MSELKVDLACGMRKEPGFTGIDIKDVEGVDIVQNLEEFPWPFEDESVDEAYCSHYVEHLNDFSGFFNELYRVLKKGATTRVVCPYYTSVRATQDYTHKRAISEESFLYLNKDWRVQQKLDFYDVNCDFDIQWGFNWHPNWKDQPEAERQFAKLHYWNVVTDVFAILTKK